MAAKPEATPPPAAAAADAAAAGADKKSGPSPIMAMLPAIIALVGAPLVTWAVIQFVLMGKLEQRLIAATGNPEAAKAALAAKHGEEAKVEEAAHGAKAGAHGGGKDAKGEKAEPTTYEFANVVVNLAGTMGTRYLKISFLITGKDKELRATFEKNKPQMVDVHINVLSALTIPDTEEPGSKNLIRMKLVNADNQALGKHLVDQVYLTEFVVQ